MPRTAKKSEAEVSTKASKSRKKNEKVTASHAKTEQEETLPAKPAHQPLPKSPAITSEQTREENLVQPQEDIGNVIAPSQAIEPDERGYRINLRFNFNSKKYTAIVPELDNLTTESDNRHQLIDTVEQSIHDKLDSLRMQHLKVPQPVDQDTFSGKISASISPHIHRELLFRQKLTGLSLDQLIGELLAFSLGYKSGRRDAPHHNNQHNGHQQKSSNHYESSPKKFDQKSRSNHPPQRTPGYFDTQTASHSEFMEYLRNKEKKPSPFPSPMAKRRKF